MTLVLFGGEVYLRPLAEKVMLVVAEFVTEDLHSSHTNNTRKRTL